MVYSLGCGSGGISVGGKVGQEIFDTRYIMWVTVFSFRAGGRKEWESTGQSVIGEDLP